MFDGNDSNTAATPFLNNPFQYSADPDQLQLCRNYLPAEINVDAVVNYLGSDRGTPFLHPNNKCGRGDEAIPRQQHQQLLHLNNESFNHDTDRKATVFSQNPVFTGLKLSYDEEERNSSLTSASGNLRAAPSVFSYVNNDIKRELDQQKQELDRVIKTQEESMVKGLQDIRRRHMSSFISALEQSVLKKLHEKDTELEAVTRKNKELIESTKHAAGEAQNWHYMAKYNESVVNVLKTNLQQAMQSLNATKEGFGETDADDAASSIDPNNYLGSVHTSSGINKRVTCRSCKSKRVSMLLMPCRHLCVCKDCEVFVNFCPVCQMMKTASFDVYLS